MNNRSSRDATPSIREHQRRGLSSFGAMLTMGFVTWFSSITFAVSAHELIIVQGASGTDEYAQQFSTWTAGWHEVAKRMQANVTTITPSTAGSGQTCREQLTTRLSTLEPSASDPAWIVLIGHGTYYGDEAKFNLAGPDITARELATWLQPCAERSIAIINCSSSSGVFVNRLSGPNRVIVTSTKSGIEQNFARFGQYLVNAAGEATADLDHDGTVSLLEAFLMGSRQTQGFYSDEGRLATEHAILDDNGDGVGTTEDFFQGIRAVGKSQDANRQVDGLRAHQWTLYRYSEEQELSAEKQQLRNQLEQEIETLRLQKNKLSEDEYYKRLEPLLIEIAKIYGQ